jgi:hypothetical protein
MIEALDLKKIDDNLIVNKNNFIFLEKVSIKIIFFLKIKKILLILI